jgi:putative tryptophan/tyrosine transport system substrate-binding protein
MDKPEPRDSQATTHVPRVAVLFFGPRGLIASTPDAGGLVRKRLTELGYLEGKTIMVEEHYADADPQRLTQLARDIVESKPDVIVAMAAAATEAARQATSTIPIVMVHAGNPVGSGLVASLANPGGNVTGSTSMVPDLGAKQVEILRQLIPRLAKLGVLTNATNAATPPFLTSVIEAARNSNISVVVAQVTRAEDFDRAFEALGDAHADALLVMTEPLIGAHRNQILDFATRNRLPSSYDVGGEMVRQGGLISYGPVLRTHYALAADYVDKILKGAKPGDLPVQQPSEFALIINLKTAKMLGITIPQSLLLRADEIIQ